MSTVSSAGEILREARLRAGLSQVGLAQRAGTTQSVISVYESGRRQPSLPVLRDLVAATGHDLLTSLARREGVDLSRPAPLSGPLGKLVRRHRRRITELAAAHGVGDVRVFGSVARGTDGPDSDVDLLVDVTDGVGLFALGHLRGHLEELLGVRVDVVPAAGVKPDARSAVDADLVTL